MERLRSQGDSRDREGRADEAKDLWRGASAIVESWLGTAPTTFTAEELANVHGISGGLARRLGDLHGALASYRSGAAIERTENLSATYNRTNAIKYALITGDGTLADRHDELVELGAALDRTLANDTLARDNAWLRADLGDVRLLLGEDAEAAASYRSFARNARSTSPDATLEVIRKVAAALIANDDPAKDRVAASVAAAEQVLADYLRAGR